MINKVDKFRKEALDEMFKRVGFNGYDKRFTEKRANWYSLNTWSEKEELRYKEWFIEKYIKTFKSNKTFAKSEASWWLFNYGWKCKYGTQ